MLENQELSIGLNDAKIKTFASARAREIQAFEAWPSRAEGVAAIRAWHGRGRCRSEEHTSELQSLLRTSYAVFCLNKKIATTHNAIAAPEARSSYQTPAPHRIT